MPRKSKDESIELNNEILVKDKNKSNSKSKSKASTSKVSSSTKKANASAKKATSKTNKVSLKSEKVITKKGTSNSTSIQVPKSKKTSSSKKVAKKKTATPKKEIMLSKVEYYDLPYRYNETVVKILAQTPTMLFIYWDISDADRKAYIDKYGEDFFNSTKPVLKVTNRTMNYSFEIDINDFANSWYLHVNDADCDYAVELGRRPIYSNSNIDNYIYVSTSNDMEMPNSHILFDKLGRSVFFKNVKTNYIEEKEISSLSFIRNLGKVYDIYELYKELYDGEINIEELDKENMRLNLSSSNSSTFK